MAIVTNVALVQNVRRGTAATACLISLGGLAFGTLEGWPLWARGLGVIVPWLPIFVSNLTFIYRRYGWLALFYALVVTQTGHLFEHVAQMIQIHILGLTGVDAQGVFGTLNVEWVHFVWNTWVLLAVLVLLTRYGANRWLWLTAVLSGWHEIEHACIFHVYLMTGISGTAGLLAQGGLIGGGLPLVRPDLHFLYNLFETAPLIAAFMAQVERTGRRARQRV